MLKSLCLALTVALALALKSDAAKQRQMLRHVTYLDPCPHLDEIRTEIQAFPMHARAKIDSPCYDALLLVDVYATPMEDGQLVVFEKGVGAYDATDKVVQYGERTCYGTECLVLEKRDKLEDIKTAIPVVTRCMFHDFLTHIDNAVECVSKHQAFTQAVPLCGDPQGDLEHKYCRKVVTT